MFLRSRPWVALLIVGAAGCRGRIASTGSDSGVTDAGTVYTFQPVPPAVYVAKVKNILAALPATDAEIQSVASKPDNLTGLIDSWMQLPEYSQKMQVFFELAFQQTQITSADYVDLTFPATGIANGLQVPLVVQNSRESVARTAVAITDAGSPLTDTFTTQSFMMTTALMNMYAFFDGRTIADDGTVSDAFMQAHPGQSVYVQSAPVTMQETLDPTNANYMHWYFPDLTTYISREAAAGRADCNLDPLPFPSNSQFASRIIEYILYGGFLAHRGTAGSNCSTAVTKNSSQFLASDFTDWRVVTVRPPTGGEATTLFYDLPSLRASSQLILSIPRIGYFSTPAFMANWLTNSSNQMRVTANQALIVATGSAIDGTDPTVPPSTPGLDPVHSAPGSACYGCHQLLDPMRSIFSANYSWFYSPQTDQSLIGQKGLFAFQGVINTEVNTLTDFGNTLAAHPLTPTAWAQKLCYWANSAPCDDTDPAFQAIVTDFKNSNMSWPLLVRELMASPLITYAAPTTTSSQHPEVVSVSRRDHLCAALNSRLNLVDICGLDLFSKVESPTIQQIANGLPSDGYGRGATIPVLPNAPTIFYRAGAENICEAIANLLIDAPVIPTMPNAKQWSSANASSAVNDFINLLMDLSPSDARYAQVQSLLMAHYNQALTAQVDGGVAGPTGALRSTFIAACLAPTSVGIGL
jgi:hypothetical protein